MTGGADLVDHAPDLLEVGEPGCVQAVGARIAVGDEPRDRVVEIVDAADVVLGAAGQHDPELVRGAGGLGDARRGDADSSIPSAAGS